MYCMLLQILIKFVIIMLKALHNVPRDWHTHEEACSADAEHEAVVNRDCRVVHVVPTYSPDGACQQLSSKETGQGSTYKRKQFDK